MIDLDEAQFHRDVADLLNLPELHRSRHRAHHFDLSEYDHLLAVAQQAHRLSRLVRADSRTCARAGLLHDLGAHWFNTVAPCALAMRLEEHHSIYHAIRAHTLYPVLPKTREAWVVVAADLLTSARECHFVFRRARRRARARVHDQLLAPRRALSPIVTLPLRSRKRIEPLLNPVLRRWPTAVRKPS
jgi:hypothetical protein